jgi:hypothetical protein
MRAVFADFYIKFRVANWKKLKQEKFGEQLATPCLFSYRKHYLFIPLEKAEKEISIFQGGSQGEI